MQDLIRACDFLGFNPSLHIKGETRYKTLFTGVISIAIVLVSLLSSGYFGSKLFERNSPLLITSIESIDKFPSYQVSNKGFMFFIALERPDYSYYADKSIFTVQASTLNLTTWVDSTGKSQQTVTHTPVNVDLCSTYYKDEDILEKNIKLPLNLGFCVEPNTTFIAGNYGADSYHSVRVDFLKCVNSTLNNNTCKPQEEIDSVIQNGYLAVDFTNYIADPKNFTQPLSRIMYDMFNLLNVNSSIEYNINLIPITYNSDNGFLLDDIQTHTGTNFDIRVFNRITRSDFICSVTFQGKTESIVNTRSYIKIQTVITQIGGFIKAVTLLGNIVSLFFSQNHFFFSFMMDFVSIQEPRVTNNSMLQSNLPLIGRKNNSDVPIRRETIQVKKINDIESKDGTQWAKMRQLRGSDVVKLALNNQRIKLHAKMRSEVNKVVSVRPEVNEGVSVTKVLLDYLCFKLCPCKNGRNKKATLIMLKNMKNLYVSKLCVENIIQVAIENKLVVDHIKTDLIDFEKEYLKSLTEEVQKGLNMT